LAEPNGTFIASQSFMASPERIQIRIQTMSGRFSEQVVEALLASEHRDFWTNESQSLHAGSVRVFIRPVQGLYYWSVTFPAGGIADGHPFWAIVDAKANLRAILEQAQTSLQSCSSDQANGRWPAHTQTASELSSEAAPNAGR
jgi:hypothetical protein